MVQMLLMERSVSDDRRATTRSYISHADWLFPLCSSVSSVVSPLPKYAFVGGEAEVPCLTELFCELAVLLI